MEENLVEIKTADGICQAYVYYPKNGITKFHPVIMYMDAFGIRPAMQELASKLATKGYLVLLPNVFYRISKIPVPTTNLQELIATLTPDLMLKDAEAYLNFIAHHEKSFHEKVALVGYCFGGGYAVRTAARFPDQISVVASFHGGNLASDDPSSPHLLLSQVKAELYFAHADHDKSMPPEQIERLESALEENQNEFISEIYPNALHGFTMRDRPAFNQEASDRHWNNLYSLLEKNY